MFTQGLSTQFSARVQGRDTGTGTVPEFWRGYQEKRCVHIGAWRRIEPGHGARAPSVNTALEGQHGCKYVKIAGYLASYFWRFCELRRRVLN